MNDLQVGDIVSCINDSKTDLCCFAIYKIKHVQDDFVKLEHEAEYYYYKRFEIIRTRDETDRDVYNRL